MRNSLVDSGGSPGGFWGQFLGFPQKFLGKFASALDS